jgi:hypothetical protein
MVFRVTLISVPTLTFRLLPLSPLLSSIMALFPPWAGWSATNGYANTGRTNASAGRLHHAARRCHSAANFQLAI